MKTQLLQNENLTIEKILSITKDLSATVLIYNSCFYPTYTQEILEKCEVHKLEPIEDLYEESLGFVAAYRFENIGKPIKLKQLRELPEEKLKYNIERDVDDGFRYKYYETIVYNDKIIILC